MSFTRLQLTSSTYASSPLESLKICHIIQKKKNLLNLLYMKNYIGMHRVVVEDTQVQTKWFEVEKEKRNMLHTCLACGKPYSHNM
jgi:hypothetical protein